VNGELIASPVRPLVTPAQAAADWALFEELKDRLLVDDDYQAIAGKRYIKRSGFRKIAVYFGLSDRLLKEERKDRDDKSFTWHIVVEAYAPNGRTSVGVGVCDSKERSFAHVEHDVYATAHTRAKSRAISDMVAGGAVSAEEVEATAAVATAPKKVDAEAKVRGKLKSGVLEDEAAVKAILEMNDLPADGFTITVYGDYIWVLPPKSLDPDTWADYDKVFGYVQGKWNEVARRWELPRP